MAPSRKVVCLVLCSLHAAAAFAPHAPAAFLVTRARASAVPVHSAACAATRPRASAVPVHSAAFVESVAAKARRALKQTLQPATATWLVTTQAALLLEKITENAFGVALDLADLFLSQKLLLRLSVSMCSVFCNKMLNTDKIGAFVVAQGVLAVSAACTGNDPAAIFTVYSVFERLSVYTIALIMPTVLGQARRLAHRLGLYMRSLRMSVFAYRAFA